MEQTAAKRRDGDSDGVSGLPQPLLSPPNRYRSRSRYRLPYGFQLQQPGLELAHPQQYLADSLVDGDLATFLQFVGWSGIIR